MPPGLLLMTLAGGSSRFAAAGVSQPKWSLPLGGSSLLEHALVSAGSLLESGFVPLFVVLSGQEEWLERSLPSGPPVPDQVVSLPSLLPGQALSAAAALGRVDPDRPLVIWDADMLLLPPPPLPSAGSWLLLSRGLPGSQWAFAALDDRSRLSAVAERVRVGPYAALGMYGFASVGLFVELVSEAADAASPEGGEMSVAPLYGLLPRGSVDGCVVPAGQVRPVGTPSLFGKAAADLGLPAQGGRL